MDAPSISRHSGDERNEKRLEAMYGRYGIVALVVSRLIPGVRALVPPFAGALKVPPYTAISAMAIASAVWYGIIATSLSTRTPSCRSWCAW